MNINTYLMIKKANELASNCTSACLSTNKPKYVPGAGFRGGLGNNNRYVDNLLASRDLSALKLSPGVIMGTGPDGKTFAVNGPTVDGPSIANNSSTTGNNKSGTSDFVKRHILRSSTLGTDLGGTL